MLFETDKNGKVDFNGGTVTFTLTIGKLLIVECGKSNRKKSTTVNDQTRAVEDLGKLFQEHQKNFCRNC